jgi:hypothetical protein
MVSKLIEVWVDCFCYFFAAEFWHRLDGRMCGREQAREMLGQNDGDFGWGGEQQQQIPFGDDNKRARLKQRQWQRQQRQQSHSY